MSVSVCSSESSTGGEISSALRLRAAVMSRRAQLASLLKTRGELILRSYLEELLTSSHPITEEARRLVAQRVKTLLGESAASGVAAQLAVCPAVITGDHHGLLTHPILVQSNALVSCVAAGSGLGYQIVFAFGCLPLNNATYPRGVIWAGERFPIFPDRLKHSMVCAAEAFRPEMLQRLPQEIRSIIQTTPGVFELPSYAAQATVVNRELWTSVFSGKSGTPQLVYLQAEDIASDLLVTSLNKGDELARVLLDPETRASALKALSAIQGGRSRLGGGTDLFWALGKTGKGIKLTVEQGSLIGEDCLFELESEVISDALTDRRLVPGLFLSYLALLKHGFVCLGGFNQLDYFARLREAWLNCLVLQDSRQQAADIKGRRYQGYLCGLLALMDKDRRPQGLEAFIPENAGAISRLERMLEGATLNQAAALGLPSLYPLVFAEEERDAVLSAVSVDDLIREFGLGNVIEV